MKKVKLFIIIILMLIIVGILISNINNKELYTEIDGIKYAILVDDIKATSFPNGVYKVDVNCNNANAYWDSVNEKIIINNINNDINCSISFDSSISNNDMLNNYIKDLNDNTQGDGMLIHETSILPTNNTTWTKQTMIVQNISGNVLNVTNSVYNGNQTTQRTSSSNKFYPQSDGFYKLCYSIPSSSYTGNNTSYKNYIRYYSLNTTSTNSTTIYSNYNNGATIEDCNIIGNMKTTDYINIINYYYDQNITFYLEKADDTYIVDTGYRYEGANPNNYIMFNNELWRIIGVFNETSHGQTNKYLVKIIKNNILEGLVWNKTSSNDWSTSSLYTLLNNHYYDWETNKSTIDNYCYIASNATKACDFTLTGIKDGYREMIKNTTWYLGGPGKTGYTTNTPYHIYQYERNNDAVYSNGTNITRPASTTGYIGLMYESDYLLGVPESSCSRLTTHNNYNNNQCLGNNWIIGFGEEHVLTPDSSRNSNSYSLGYSGSINSTTNTSNKGVRPVLYLSENVYRVAGTGTMTDPYIIGLAVN